MRKPKGPLIAFLCGVAVALNLPVPASAAPGDPLFVFVPTPPQSGSVLPPPTGYLNGPCGLAVDAGSRFYVADYYHHAVDVYSANAGYASISPPPTGATGFLAQIAGVDPLGGPCAMAFDGSSNLYVNAYHRNVQKFGAFSSFPAGAVFDTDHPTGVAVNSATGRVYVNNRSHVSVYDTSGAPVLDGGGQPMRIGEGTLEDGYGLAVSAHAGSSGRVYVPDAGSGTVKVYDPAVDLVDPVAEIEKPPGGPFSSLRDSAVAVDRVTGEVYVADDTQPQQAERPQAAVYVFDAAGSFKGRLKYKVVTARPPGLAVDNSFGASQGRVYVTSGNTSQAAIYAYPPGSALSGEPLPPSFPLALSAQGTGQGEVSASLGGLSCASACEAEIRAGANVTLSGEPRPGSAFLGWLGEGCAGTGPCTLAMSEARSVSARFGEQAGPPAPRATIATSEVAQRGTLRLTVSGELSPKRLPRIGVTPISVSIGGDISTTDGTLPPQLKRMRIELNRHGRLDYTGLPVCDYNRIQPASSARALAGCRTALVGRGRFSAIIALAGQEPYVTGGRLLVFNGARQGRPVLYGHIYTSRPFATSFVIVFEIHKLRGRTYGTALSAKPPKAFERWGNLTGLEMTLSRRYSYAGHRRSYVSAGCPAPKGFTEAFFPLARTSFTFAEAKKLTSVLVSNCQVRR
jgi:hypothetical protein